jgi:hypothetical protein
LTIYNVAGEWDNPVDDLIKPNYFESYIQHITPNNHHNHHLNTHGDTINPHNINPHH